MSNRKVHIGELFAMSVHLVADDRVSDRAVRSGEISMSHLSENGERKQQAIHDLKDARTAIAMGAGVGTIGTASAILLGATCPICVVMAPALIGIGLIKSYAANKKLKAELNSPQ